MPESRDQSTAVRRLTRSVGQGVKELPSNAAWLVSKAAGHRGPASVTHGMTHGLADTARQAGVAVVDALPVGGDSIELRMQRARAAVADAQQAEDAAIQESIEAEHQAQEAERVAERCRAYVRDVESEQHESVEQCVEQARREADARIEATRRDAEAEAARVTAEARSEADATASRARDEADQAHARATERLEAAREKLEEARRLAEEAMRATKEAADEAYRQAQQVAADAEADARAADQRLAEAEGVRNEAAERQGDVAQHLNGSGPGGLGAMNKQQLLDLAATRGLEGRSTMTKAQLVKALDRRSTSSRKAGAK
ncbi:MAG TPA: hypothetical protein PLZ93_09285 [Nocardioides sp.]|uniref:hypothetical protein n=1 Tax=uncultured Nocardioides sp. TaxID=198441 RepID=UPI000EB8B19D|nr:hypothetical protein [uncultured Nocardioides sp.]HCB07698.1 hypothetical protein [Nocardioides sp.]HRD61772.1 hypothetical protein [Nocardioides sp.]HRI95794.1 hypothetical protein [Nocardioides sp.]HRK47613.1 hypothetical protein [Nocardioides sp.]